MSCFTAISGVAPLITWRKTDVGYINFFNKKYFVTSFQLIYQVIFIFGGYINFFNIYKLFFS